MKFKFLLYIIGRKVISRVRNDPDYKKKVTEKDCIVQIKTDDNLKGRFYKFHDGDVTSKSGISDSPSVSLVWKDADTAYSSLSAHDAAKRVTDALSNGSLKLEGDGAIALWFFDVVKNS